MDDRQRVVIDPGHVIKRFSMFSPPETPEH
jgi:hypothetical protein